MSDHLKQQIKGKLQERDRLESTILECTTRLEASGVGLHDKLVDKEVNGFTSLICLLLRRLGSKRMHVQGFPRADIDISVVRADRQQVAGACSVFTVCLCHLQHLV